ncbi:succinate dehydrogenase, cytochrome b556 subunit [Pseudaquidulcibacter saccharophilus]|uniref:succinate dehydrogenase, cytochrome b556 subunit n=1 Tax=Pseudaquidulcibacter saccharophilus TaxID=2831900 RepID=UPI001EFF0B4A|nr:succinate dehydrogenase, cytochrome b556 subunit [Pseudaquidulcibacter saccharophilus]
MTEVLKSQKNTRPVSPHLQIWRWHVTMTSSILHRVTGVGNTVGMILLIAWVCCLSNGPEAYAKFTGLIGSPLGLLVVLGSALAISYHIINGIRHLLFNLGVGLTKEVASKTAWAAIILGILGGIGMFLLALQALAK